LREALAANKPSEQEGGNRSEVDDGNVIVVTFGDLTEEDQRCIREEMRRELEEVEAMKMREKLACYQKMRGGVVQKADTAKVSASKVSSSTLPHEELTHLVDISVASKYGTYVAQLTHVLAEDVSHSGLLQARPR
jgi:hypothetical protein